MRQGWYSVPDAPEEAVRAVRIGGRLTGRSALQSYGIDVLRPRRPQIAVKDTDARVYGAVTGRSRRMPTTDADIRWTLTANDTTASPWRVSMAAALLEVIRTESRDVTVACCDLLVNTRAMTLPEVERIFGSAPLRTRAWFGLVDGRAAAFGETFVRLWLGDEGIRFIPQPFRRGVGYLDGRISRWTFVEIDGSQHAQEGWMPDRSITGDELGQMEVDRRRDVVLAIGGERSLRFTYRLLLREWPICLAAMRRAIADDERRELLEASAAALRKRRTNAYRRAVSRRIVG